MINFLLKNPETTVYGKVRNILAAFTLALICNIIFMFIIDVSYDYKIDQFGYTPPSKLYLFIFSIIVAPLWEELAFRVAPFKIAKIFGDAALLPVLILSTCLFGWGHGYGPVSLLNQGTTGLIFAMVYLKNGYSYWSSVSLHALWNLMVIYFLPYYTS